MFSLEAVLKGSSLILGTGKWMVLLQLGGKCKDCLEFIAKMYEKKG